MIFFCDLCSVVEESCRHRGRNNNHRIPTSASGISEHILRDLLMAERLGRNFSENII